VLALQDEEVEDPAALPPPGEPSDTDDDVVLLAIPAAPKAKRHKAAAPPVGGGGGSSSAGGDGGGDGGDPPPPPLPLPPPGRPPSPGSDSDVAIGDPGVPAPRPDVEEDDDVAIGAVVPRVVRVDRPGWGDGVGGHRVKYDPAYRAPRTGKLFTPHWSIDCLQHGYKCGRTRHVNAGSVAVHGAIEVVAFLHVWAPCATAPGKTHARTDPQPQDVTRFVEAHRDKLEEIVLRAGA
jgi:hypothetical protein